MKKIDLDELLLMAKQADSTGDYVTADKIESMVREAAELPKFLREPPKIKVPEGIRNIGKGISDRARAISEGEKFKAFVEKGKSTGRAIKNFAKAISEKLKDYLTYTEDFVEEMENLEKEYSFNRTTLESLKVDGSKNPVLKKIAKFNALLAEIDEAVKNGEKLDDIIERIIKPNDKLGAAKVELIRKACGKFGIDALTKEDYLTLFPERTRLTRAGGILLMSTIGIGVVGTEVAILEKIKNDKANADSTPQAEAPSQQSAPSTVAPAQSQGILTPTKTLINERIKYKQFKNDPEILQAFIDNRKRTGKFGPNTKMSDLYYAAQQSRPGQEGAIFANDLMAYVRSKYPNTGSPSNTFSEAGML